MKILLVLLLSIFSSFTPKENQLQKLSGSVVYEMNVRQYTPEGTFEAAQKELPRLKELGVDIIWLMPIHPIGVKERKGTLGSYYAISDYKAINPEFGNMKDFERFLNAAQKMGFRVILDCVANHTSPDAKWIKEKPADWYMRDAEGNTIVNYDWYDIAELNYGNKAVWDAMEDQMRFWMKKGVDGFRCDMACEVPFEFWQTAIKSLRKEFPNMYMLAEGENPLLHTVSGFNASYAWELHHLLNSVARGEKSGKDLAEYVEKDLKNYPEDAFRLAFTSNHDENSWAGTEFERMGNAAKAMAVLTFTLPRTQPLIYTGQEMGWNHRFEFFEKDPIPSWEENAYTEFYRELIRIKHRNPALYAGKDGGKFELIKADSRTFEFARVLPDNRVRVKVELTEPFDYEIIEERSPQYIERVEPLSWWIGMETPLQLLIKGKNISEYDLSICGGKGVKISGVHKAESPDYLFVDVKIEPNAPAGIYDICFSKGGELIFTYPYELSLRKEGSRQRQSFTSADMIYLIMPDRFANGDSSNDDDSRTFEKADDKAYFGRHGGDLRGIIDNLDYISQLGATTIWPTPLLQDNQKTESYHGYACTDYYHIDPRFGTNLMYKEFVSVAHDKGLKVIMDVVTNHCGTEHWWMKDLPFSDWIHQFPTYTGTNICFSANMDTNASRQDLYIQESGWFVPSMPDMNLDNPFVLNYFTQWAVWWIEYAGLDGFRVDTYPYNEKVAMSKWTQAIRSEYPNFNIVGECWTSSIPQLAYWQADNANKDGFNTHLPSIMDFPLHDALRAALCEQNPGWGQGLTRIYDVLSHDFVYNDVNDMLVFAGNHDVGRIGDVLNGDVDRMRLALTMVATLRGIPQVFYGDEFMMRSVNREDPWGHGGLRADFTQGLNNMTEESRDLQEYCRKLFQWRKTADVIHNGRTLHFLTRDNTYAYFRYNDDRVVFVYLNNSNEPKKIPWDYYSEITENLGTGVDVISGDLVTISDQTVVPAVSALIVEYEIVNNR